MAVEELKRFLSFVILCFGQVLVFNHIRLFGCAMPLLCVYFAITIPRGYPKWASLLWCFTLGLAVDVFSNTPGVGTGSMTLVAMMQTYLLELFVPRDSIPNLESSLSTIGITKFATMAFILVFVYCLTFYMLEMFSFFNWLQWLLNVVASTLLTFVLIMAFEYVRQA